MDSLLHIGLSNAVVATLLALLALVAGTVCRRPAIVHGLWLLVLLKLVTPPLVRVSIPWPIPSSSPVTSCLASDPTDVTAELPAGGEEPEEGPHVLLEDRGDDPLPHEFLMSFAPGPSLPTPRPTPEPFAWGEALAAVWVLGSAGWFLLAGQRVSRFQNLLRLARPAPPSLRHRVERLARRLGLTESPSVWLVPGRVAPMLWAVGGPPRLLVPAELLNQVGRDQQDTLLLHELAHLRRHDHWVRALEFLALGLYWWHPVTWLARRQLREVEEQCCDAWVVSLLPGAGRTYATALVETLDFLADARPAVPLLASGIGQVADLKRRLTMIMRGTTPRSLGWGSTLALFGLGAVLLPALPTWARGDQKEEEKRVIHVQVDGATGAAAVLRARIEGGEDIKQLQDEIARLQAELEKKRAQLRAAQAKAEPKKDGVKEEQKQRFFRFETSPDGIRHGAIRIEIVSPNLSAEQVKEMLKSIEKSLPSGIKVDVVPGLPPVPPKPPAPPKPGVGPMAGSFGSGGGQGGGGTFGSGFGVLPPQGADPRIERLEKRLEDVLKELEALRKELKAQPPRRDERRPGAAVPVLPVDEARVLQEHARKALEERLVQLRTIEAKAADYEKLIVAKQGAAAAATAKLATFQDQLSAAEARLRAAQADLEKLKVEKERAENLFEQGSIARTEVEKAQASFVKALEHLKQLAEQNQKVKQELSQFRDRAAAENDLVKEAEKAKQETEREIARLKAQLAELEAKLKKESR